MVNIIPTKYLLPFIEEIPFSFSLPVNDILKNTESKNSGVSPMAPKNYRKIILVILFLGVSAWSFMSYTFGKMSIPSLEHHASKVRHEQLAALRNELTLNHITYLHELNESQKVLVIQRLWDVILKNRIELQALEKKCGNTVEQLNSEYTFSAFTNDMNQFFSNCQNDDVNICCQKFLLYVEGVQNRIISKLLN